MMVSRFFAAMHLNGLAHGGAIAVILVPSFSALREFSTHTGMLFCIAGRMVAGCSTFAPKYASSAASSKLIVFTRSASGQMRGSVVMMPFTSVQISIAPARSPPPTSAAV